MIMFTHMTQQDGEADMIVSVRVGSDNGPIEPSHFVVETTSALQSLHGTAFFFCVRPSLPLSLVTKLSTYHLPLTSFTTLLPLPGNV